jgi:hypothetical protein
MGDAHRLTKRLRPRNSKWCYEIFGRRIERYDMNSEPAIRRDTERIDNLESGRWMTGHVLVQHLSYTAASDRSCCAPVVGANIQSQQCWPSPRERCLTRLSCRLAHHRVRELAGLTPGHMPARKCLWLSDGYLPHIELGVKELD